jgi:HlyD family secretion protein
VAQVLRGDLVDTLSAAAVVEAYQATVAPKIVGRVEALLVDEGDRVAKGDLLARIESAEQRAALKERQAALGVAEAEVARAAAAVEQERQASTARLERARATEQAARARLQQLRTGARPQEIEAARQAVSSAEAEEQLAEADHERITQLFDEGAVSRAEADAARTRLTAARAWLRTAHEELALLEEGARVEEVEAAEADLAAAQAAVAEAQAAAETVQVLERSLDAARAQMEQAQAAVAGAASMLDETQITAPMSGVVGRRFSDVGDLVGPQSPVFLISDNDNLWVMAEVDEEDLALVHVGQRAEVAAEALAEPVTGDVVEVGAVAISRGLQQVRAKIVRCKIRLTEGSDVLRPGMEVDVTAEATLAEDVLLVPTDAVQARDGQDFVLALDSNVVHLREVTVGRRTYRDAAVEAGLDEGDLVVVSGAGDLRDGSRVRAGRG